MTVATLATQWALSDDEQVTVGLLRQRLAQVTRANELKRAWYDAKHSVDDLKIAVPPHLRNMGTVLGWPALAVDVLEERLDFEAFVTPGAADDELGLGQVVEDNQLDTELGMGILDALSFGRGYITVGRGGSGEPDPLVLVESPFTTTDLWDRVTRRPLSMLTVVPASAGQSEQVVVRLREQTIYAERHRGKWRVTDRDQHGLGRVLGVPLVNKRTGSNRNGRSEITPTVVSLCQSAVRTLVGAEVTREFFSAPKFAALGVDAAAFAGPNGESLSQWEATIGRVWAIGNDDDGNRPDIKQFLGSSPTPFIDLMKMYAQLFSAETALPPSYLGLVSDIPTSADAIRAGEARLVKRAERRQRTLGTALSEVARLALLVRDGEAPEAAPRVVWRDAATPTRAAAADEAVKLISSGVLAPDSEVTWERLNISETDRRRLAAEARARRASAVLPGPLERARVERQPPALAS